MEWKKLTLKTLPPEKVNVLLWIALNDSDGGMPTVAKRYNDPYTGEPYMCHKIDELHPRGGLIFKEDFRNCLWTEIEMPEKARVKWEKEQEAIRRNTERNAAREAERKRKLAERRRATA